MGELAEVGHELDRDRLVEAVAVVERGALGVGRPLAEQGRGTGRRAGAGARTKTRKMIPNRTGIVMSSRRMMNCVMR